MLNNILKVYDEDLINGAINASTIDSKSVVAAGGTQGALVVNVFAEGEVTTTANVVITVKHCDTENGTFDELSTITIPSEESFADGSLMASMVLPLETKAYVTAVATSDSSNSGNIRVTLGYLAR